MKVLIVALLMVGAFVKGQEESAEDTKKNWFEDMKKDMETSPCYPLMKQFFETEADCEGFTSTLVTDEQIEKIKKDSFEKMKEKFGDKFKDFKGKDGKGHEGKGFGGKGPGCKMEKQLCAIQKLGLVDEETKTLNTEKFIARFEEITDEKIKTELTEALNECVNQEYDSEAKFVNQNMCFTHKSMKICATEKQKEMFKKFHSKVGGKAEE